MRYTVILPESAQKRLDRLPDDMAEQILQHLGELETNPHPPGVKKLKARTIRVPKNTRITAVFL
jgi:mRNA-degrading endonuclease RelE of RelBE toxin-antitoxin system